MIAAKPRKTTPMDERDDDLRHTLILATNQKLERLNVEQIRTVYLFTLEVMSRKNDAQKPYYQANHAYDIFFTPK